MTSKPDIVNQLVDIHDAASLHKLIGKDFFVVTPCYSKVKPDKVLEGTRLTLQSMPPEGFEASIRTPGTPPRWIDYDKELSAAFQRLTDVVGQNAQWLRAHSLDTAHEIVVERRKRMEAIADEVLSVTFFWYNFMPLSRGTAACGFTALVGMFLACGIKVTKHVPKGVMVDWEVRSNDKLAVATRDACSS